MSRKRCLNDPNHFCYICGEFVFKDQRMPITPLIKQRYYDYFKMKISDQDKPFASHNICKKCSSNLSMWSGRRLKKMPFSTSMAWREQRNHTDDCYFYQTKTGGFKKKTLKYIEYPNLVYAIRPAAYEEDEEPPIPASVVQLSDQ